MAILLLIALAQPFPAGRHEVTLEGLKTAVIVPDEPRAMIVLLHGLGDSGLNLSRSIQHWARDGYLIVAPSSRGRAWNKADVDAAIRIAAKLAKGYGKAGETVHVMGFSNGGWNLGPLAFSDELKPVSAVWIAAGYRGGSVPKWAKERLGVLAIAGADDPNAKAAAETVPALDGKVACVEARFQEGLGHKWPRELIPYARWWMSTREGRYVPGEDLNFDWQEDLDGALQEVKDRRGRAGAWVYVWSMEDQAPHVQNEIFMDRLVRHYGGQNPAVKMQMGEEAKRLGVTETPALVVLDEKGKVKKLYEGDKLTAKRVAGALRLIAPNRRKP